MRSYLAQAIWLRLCTWKMQNHITESLRPPMLHKVTFRPPLYLHTTIPQYRPHLHASPAYHFPHQPSPTFELSLSSHLLTLRVLSLPGNQREEPNTQISRHNHSHDMYRKHHSLRFFHVTSLVPGTWTQFVSYVDLPICGRS